MRRLLVLPLTLGVLGVLAACSGILGLTEPQLFPSEAGSEAGTTPQVDASLPPDVGAPINEIDASAPRPVALETGELGRIFRLVADATHLYVTSTKQTSSGSIKRYLFKVEKATGATTDLEVSALGVARNGGELYVSTDGGSVHTCYLPGCTSFFFTAAVGLVRDFAATNGFGGTRPVAWLDVNRNEIAVPGPGQTAQRLAAANIDRVGSLHALNESLYWTELGSLAKLTKGDLTTVTRVDTMPLYLIDFDVVGATIVFAANSGGPKLMRGRLAPTSLEDVTPIAELPSVSGVRLLADGASLFVLTNAALYSCPRASCDTLTKLAAAPPPRVDADSGVSTVDLIDVATDDSAIWYGTNDGRIYSLAR